MHARFNELSGGLQPSVEWRRGIRRLWSFQARFHVFGEASLVGWTPSFAAMISGDGRVEFSLLYRSPRTRLLLLVLLVASKFVLVLGLPRGCGGNPLAVKSWFFVSGVVHSAKAVLPKQETTRNTTSEDDSNCNRTLRNSFILINIFWGSIHSPTAD